MKYRPENELLSAYLDGELTPEERAHVEQLLASSPAARQLLDELRALGATMRSLPRQALGEDLSGQVLDVAAKRKMGGSGGSQPARSRNGRMPAPLAGNSSNESRIIRGWSSGR